MNNIDYYLGFSHCLGIGPFRFNLLLRCFGDIKKAYEANYRQLSEVIGPKTSKSFIEFRQEFNIRQKLEELKGKKIQVLTRENPKCPPQLLDLEDAPICLYVKGNINNFNFLEDNFLAVVGTRTPTSYGTSIARRFARELGSLGFVIVSGMALGIDAEAHRGALDSHSKTIAILGCGVDIPYPPSNENLYNEIIDSGGLIISEFPPGMTVKPGLFIARNRLISGLSKGVLVIEGAKDSGALITAKYASEQGKEVFAVPSAITSIMSAAPNFLLKQGARLVTNVSDILDEFNLKILLPERKKIEIKLTGDEEKVYDLLTKETKTVDEISEDLSISINESMRLVTSLEIKRIIEKNFEGKYQLSD